MSYNDTSKYAKYELPEGFRYEFFKPGDEEEWVRIHIESGEFTLPCNNNAAILERQYLL